MSENFIGVLWPQNIYQELKWASEHNDNPKNQMERCNGSKINSIFSHSKVEKKLAQKNVELK